MKFKFHNFVRKITGYTRQLQDWIAGAIDIGVDMI